MLSRRTLFALLSSCLASGILAASEPPSTRTYYLAFLKRNPARTQLNKDESDRVQAAHMANIHAMADRGVLVAAGPFDDTPSVISGVFFFVTPTEEETRKVAGADPTVVEHRNTVEVLAWRGPLDIGEDYKRLHRANPQTPEDMGVHPFVILRRTDKVGDLPLVAEEIKYWEKLRSGGKVIASGGVDGDSSAAAVVIFDRIADSEAASLVADAPAVKAGALKAEQHRWWCAAHVFPR